MMSANDETSDYRAAMDEVNRRVAEKDLEGSRRQLASLDKKISDLLKRRDKLIVYIALTEQKTK